MVNRRGNSRKEGAREAPGPSAPGGTKIPAASAIATGPAIPAISAAVAVIALVAVWAIGRGANPGPIGFRLDDAWIHLVYGRGLLRDGFLAYAPGVPSTGCTSPLWAVVLAALHGALGGSPAPGSIVGAVLAAGAALQVTAAIAAADLTRRLTGVGLAGIVGGAVIALAMPWTAAAFSGMEVTLTGLLLLLGVRAAVGGGWTAAGVWLALAGLARPESGIVTMVVAGMVIVRSAPSARPAVLLRLLAPSAVAAAAFVGYDLWASGAPLPATFYAKNATSFGDLPRRFAVAMSQLLTAVPPLMAGLGWIALAGYWPWSGKQRAPGAERAKTANGAPAISPLLPLAAGGAFLLANLLLIDPADPAAFYHLRYLLPSVPLLLVALVVGASRVGAALPPRFARFARVPVAALLGLTLVEAAIGVGPVSRHLHNDVRNINEVQRRIGVELGAALPPGTWIAASDAGAIRYFSDLPTVDVIGLNTPEMLAPDDAFVQAHPVEALVVLPAWFRALETDRLETVLEATTRNYTVTGDPRMARQIVLRAKRGALPPGGGMPPEGAAPPSAVRVRFVGFHRFALDFLTGGR